MGFCRDNRQRIPGAKLTISAGYFQARKTSIIVVDTNILAYLYLPCVFRAYVEQLLLDLPDWAFPFLWQNEFRNILADFISPRLVNPDITGHNVYKDTCLDNGQTFPETALRLELGDR